MNRYKTINVINPVSKETFLLLQQTYGALSDDGTNPLSLISLASSSLSIDLWTGCAWQCVYCHTQGCARNLVNGRMPIKADRIKGFSFSSVVNALKSSPYFIPGETIISIGTSSTEPLGGIGIMNDVFSLLSEIQDKHHLNNPIWIVTKAGVPAYFLSKIPEIVKKTKSLILALTSNGLNNMIEPCQNDRFLNAKEAQKLGAKILLYLRPLVQEWGSTPKKIEQILQHATKSFDTKGPDAIVIGGLRWCEGIEYGLQLRKLTWPTNLKKIENVKDFSDEFLTQVKAICCKYYPQVPIFLHSSCAVSFVLNNPDVGMHYLTPDICRCSQCPKSQQLTCNKTKNSISKLKLSMCTKRLKNMDIDLTEEELTKFLCGSENKRNSLEKQIIIKVLSECLKV